MTGWVLAYPDARQLRILLLEDNLPFDLKGAEVVSCKVYAYEGGDLTKTPTSLKVASVGTTADRNDVNYYPGAYLNRYTGLAKGKYGLRVEVTVHDTALDPPSPPTVTETYLWPAVGTIPLRII